MLTIATVGMAGYELYSPGSGLLDLLLISQLALLANLSSIFLGAMPVFAGLFIRVGLPGSLALALAAVSGLQSLALHNATPLRPDRPGATFVAGLSWERNEAALNEGHSPRTNLSRKLITFATVLWGVPPLKLSARIGPRPRQATRNR